MSQRILLPRMPKNPLLQALYFAVGGVLVVGALLMGAVILSIALGVAFIAGLVIWIRLWWLSRKLERGRGGTDASGRGPGHSTEIIDVEYTVIEERDDRDRRD